MRFTARRLLLGTVMLVSLSAPVSGQASDDAPVPVRVRWDAANALVFADTSDGVQLWFATNMHATQDGRPAQRQLCEAFAPEAVDDWTVLTRQLLQLDAPPVKGDTSSVISSGVLRGQGGTRLVAGRLRDGEHLQSGVRLLVMPKEGGALAFDLRTQALDALLGALEAAVPGSRLSPSKKTGGGTTGSPVTVDPASDDRPRYPEGERVHNNEGEVWAEFTVDSTGRVDLSTFRVMLSDGRAFERTVRSHLADARFIPARVNDHPVRQRVRQRFTFEIRP